MTTTPNSLGFEAGQIVQVISAYSTEYWGAEMTLMNDRNAVVVYQENGKVGLFVWDADGEIFTEYNGDDEETPVRYIHAPGSEDEQGVIRRIEDRWADRVRIKP